MATEKMIRSLAKDLATLIAAIDVEQESYLLHEVGRSNGSKAAEEKLKHIPLKKTNKKD